MPAEFENKIQQKMQEFSLEPSPQVWEDVSAALNKRKKRRVFAWWWLYATGVLLAVAIGGIIYKETGNKTQNSSIKAQDLKGKEQDLRSKELETKNNTQDTNAGDQEVSLGKQDVRGKTQDAKSKDQEVGLARQDADTRKQDSGNKRAQETDNNTNTKSLGKEDVNDKALDKSLARKAVDYKAEKNKLTLDKRHKLNTTVLAGTGYTHKNAVVNNAAGKAAVEHTAEANRTVDKDNNTSNAAVSVLHDKPSAKEDTKVLETKSNITNNNLKKPASENINQPGYADSNVVTNNKSNISANQAEQTAALSDSSKIKDSSLVVKTLSKNAVVNTPVSPTAGFKKTKAKTSHWSLYFAGGISNTHENNIFKINSAGTLFSSSTPALGGSGSVAGSVIPDSLKSLSASNEGFHVTGGVQYQQNLHRRWTFYTGLLYSFISNTQKTGSLKNNNLALYDGVQLALNNSRADKSSIPYYYYGGNSNTLTNYAHWLEVPASISYTFNPRSAVKVGVNTGASIAWMFAYKWLLTDKTYNIYYYHKAYTNNLLFNWHAGVSVSLPKQIIIGLQYKYSLSTVAKSYIQPPLYWSNTSLYITIPLFKK